MKNSSKKMFLWFWVIYVILNIIVNFGVLCITVATGMTDLSLMMYSLPVIAIFGLISQIFIHRLAKSEGQKGIKIASCIAIGYFSFSLSMCLLVIVARLITGA